ncbi:carotene dioxygenase, partial [Jimgerdemannia flammicorona]
FIQRVARSHKKRPLSRTNKKSQPPVATHISYQVMAENTPIRIQNCPETREPLRLGVKGQIPKWLEGVFYKAGQGVFNIDLNNGKTHHIAHPFDGLSIVHRFEFDGRTNKVLYSSRYTAEGVAKRLAQEDDTLIMFGGDPCKTIFGKAFAFYHRVKTSQTARDRMHEEDPTTELVNVTVMPNFPMSKEARDAGMGLVVKTDANILQYLDRDTLEPKQLKSYTDIHPSLVGQTSAAHPQYDEDTEEYFNFTLNLGLKVEMTVFKLDANGKCPKHTTITKPKGGDESGILPSYIHSMSLTDRYLVLPNYPFYFAYNGLGLVWSGSLADAFYWDGDKPTLLHVIDRQTMKHVATYEADTYFAFHTLNAWDDGDDIVFDVSAYDDASIMYRSNDFLELEPAARPRATVGDAAAQVRRYRLKDVPMVAASQSYRASWMARNFSGVSPIRPRAEYDVVGEDIELGRYNERYNRRPYRYVYGISTKKPEIGLQKLDLVTGRSIRWEEPGMSASEAVFIPCPDHDAAEDDGVVLSILNAWPRGNRCTLVVLDARTFKEIARAEVGEFTASTLHGSFVDPQGRSLATN